jgi:hypothetical protein
MPSASHIWDRTLTMSLLSNLMYLSVHPSWSEPPERGRAEGPRRLDTLVA